MGVIQNTVFGLNSGGAEVGFTALILLTLTALSVAALARRAESSARAGRFRQKAAPNLGILTQAPEARAPQAGGAPGAKGERGRSELPNDRGMSQITLKTSRNYRLTSLVIAVFVPLGVLGTPLFSPTGQAGDVILRLVAYGLSLLAVWHAIWVLSWRMSYDSIGLSQRNRLLQPEARMWRALTAITTDGPFITLFHFADGLVMRVPNFITGRRQMMRTAQSWAKHGRAPHRP